MQLCVDDKQVILILVNIVRFYNFSFTVTTSTLKGHTITKDLRYKNNIFGSMLCNIL
jgi:hypothetical protein